MDSTMLSKLAVFAQQDGGGAYAVGQIVGVIFIAVLAGAILWKFLKKK